MSRKKNEWNGTIERKVFSGYAWHTVKGANDNDSGKVGGDTVSNTVMRKTRMFGSHLLSKCMCRCACEGYGSAGVRVCHHKKN